MCYSRGEAVGLPKRCLTLAAFLGKLGVRYDQPVHSHVAPAQPQQSEYHINDVVLALVMCYSS